MNLSLVDLTGKVVIKDFGSALTDSRLMSLARNSSSEINLARMARHIDDLRAKENVIHFGAYINQVPVCLFKLGPINDRSPSDLSTLISNPEYRGKGLGHKFIRVGMTVAKIEYKIRKLESTVFSINQASLAAYQKAGWEIEGIRKQSVKKNGDIIDVIQIGCILSNWNDQLPYTKRQDPAGYNFNFENEI